MTSKSEITGEYAKIVSKADEEIAEALAQKANALALILRAKNLKKKAWRIYIARLGQLKEDNFSLEAGKAVEKRFNRALKHVEKTSKHHLTPGLSNVSLPGNNEFLTLKEYAQYLVDKGIF